MSLIGGESTGKSTLARRLAEVLPGLLVPEVLRTWVRERGRVPDAVEQWEVMRLQSAAEAAALRDLAAASAASAASATQFASADGPPPPRWVISDSGPLMTAVYSMLYYDDGSLLPVALSSIRGSALVVWCGDEIPWEAEVGVRDGEHMRAEAQRLIDSVLRDVADPPVIGVRGTVADRADQVRKALR